MKSTSVQHNAAILAEYKKKQREAANKGKQPLTEHKKKYQSSSFILQYSSQFNTLIAHQSNTQLLNYLPKPAV